MTELEQFASDLIIIGEGGTMPKTYLENRPKGMELLLMEKELETYAREMSIFRVVVSKKCLLGVLEMLDGPSVVLGYKEYLALDKIEMPVFDGSGSGLCVVRLSDLLECCQGDEELVLDFDRRGYDACSVSYDSRYQYFGGQSEEERYSKSLALRQPGKI